jgi:hypothetical protein
MNVRSDRIATPSLRVFTRVIHPEWFQVIKSRRVTRTGWNLDIRVLFGGHSLTWATGDIRLSEILVDPQQALPSAGLVFHASPRQERSTTLRPAQGIEYQICYSIERLDPEVFRHVNEELLVNAQPGTLVWQEPLKDRFSLAATSRIDLDAQDKRLLIQAFHTIPDALAIVRTQSLFELSGLAG